MVNFDIETAVRPVCGGLIAAWGARIFYQHIFFKLNAFVQRESNFFIYSLGLGNLAKWKNY